MISLNNPNKALKVVAKNIQALRLNKGLTQQGLSDRSGVTLSTLRKFEQKGTISLESFFKLVSTLGCLDKLIEATQSEDKPFLSIEEVSNQKEYKTPKRGWRK